MEKSINISGLTNVTAILRDVSNFLSSTQPMQDCVDDCKDIIIEKTGMGVNFLHQKFAPYSPAYSKKKGKTKVDLRDTGTMLNSITAKAMSANHGKVFVGAHSDIAEYHNEGAYMKARLPQRRFMDINDTQLAALTKKHWDDPIMKLLGRR